MSTPIIIKYPLDLTGTASTNLVQGELVSVPRTRSRAFAPNYGPYFADSVVITTIPGNVVLTKGVDYETLYLYELATRKAGQPICAVIYITNPDIHGQLSVDYQVVGGEFSSNVSAIQQLIQSLEIDNRAVVWDDILDLPVTFPPSPHLHHVGDWYGMEDLVDAIADLKNAILVGSEDQTNDILDRIDAIYALILALQQKDGLLDLDIQSIRDAIALLNSGLTNTNSSLSSQILRINDIMSYIRFNVISAATNTLVNRRYFCTLTVTHKLPNASTAQIGDCVEFSHTDGVVPVYEVLDLANDLIKFKNKTDVRIQHDIKEHVYFIYTGNRIWECIRC